MNDLGNARRVFEAAGGRLLWLADAAGGKGAWVAFDGTRWSADEGPARALAYAQRAATAIADEVAALRDCEPDELSGVFRQSIRAKWLMIAAANCGRGP
jgi:hypothetical protein